MNYERYRPQSGGFQLLPEVVKNLLIINGIMYLATVVLGNTIDLVNLLGLHYFTSPDFRIYQLVTYMFMHGSMAHVFFNMFALWMFGSAVENVWGPRRFLTYYVLTGLGAAVFHYGLVFFGITPNYDSVLVGASGAVMGLLLAYGMLFPNNLLYLYFFIPIKAKYVVIGYGFLELFFGVYNAPQDSVAHFAHIGGIVTGIIVIQIWKRKNKNRSKRDYFK